MRRVLLAISICVFLVAFHHDLSAAEPVSLYNIQVFWIQQRVYEDAGEYNRILFGIENASDGTAVTQDPVTSVTLVDPNNDNVTINYGEFNQFEFLFGSFSPCQMEFTYNQSFVANSEYFIDFEGTPIPGQYTLSVTTDDGYTHISTDNLYFSQIVKLPKISSKSFRGGKDSSGNFYFFWDPPSDFDFWNTVAHNTDVRTSLNIFDNGSWVADIFVSSIPPSLGFLKIPFDVMLQLLKPKVIPSKLACSFVLKITKIDFILMKYS